MRYAEQIEYCGWDDVALSYLSLSLSLFEGVYFPAIVHPFVPLFSLGEDRYQAPRRGWDSFASVVYSTDASADRTNKMNNVCVHPLCLPVYISFRFQTGCLISSLASVSLLTATRRERGPKTS